MIKIMLGSIPHQKLFFFIIYQLEDEQDLSLGMLIHLRRIYNFWLFHANIIQLLHTFGNFLYDLLDWPIDPVPSASSYFLHVFCIAEYPYQTKSKCNKFYEELFCNICDFWEVESTQTEAHGLH